jgi:hypothetical protein
MKAQRMHYRLVLVLASLTSIACQPATTDCTALAPTTITGITTSSTPSGEHGCTGRADGVSITYALKRHGIGWERGEIWINGTPTTEATFATDLAHAQSAQAVQEHAAQVRSTAKALANEAAEATRALKKFLK